MEMARYFDSKQDRSHEFIRYHLSKNGEWYVLEVLQCKLFSGEAACGELYIEEYRNQSEAQNAYAQKISLAQSTAPNVLIQKEIGNSK